MAKGANLPTLAVKVTPKASKNEISGWTDSSPRELSVRVCAPPEGGKANKAVCETVASALGIAKSKVTVKRGQTSHHKQLEIEVDQSTFDNWLEKM